jgi:hypothetical protein
MQRIWNVKTRVIPVIIGATGTISKSLRKYVSKTQQETMKLGNYRKQPYWALHTYFGKCQRKSTVEPTQKLEIYAQ